MIILLQNFALTTNATVYDLLHCVSRLFNQLICLLSIVIDSVLQIRTPESESLQAKQVFSLLTKIPIIRKTSLARVIRASNCLSENCL